MTRNGFLSAVKMNERNKLRKNQQKSSFDTKFNKQKKTKIDLPGIDRRINRPIKAADHYELIGLSFRLKSRTL